MKRSFRIVGLVLLLGVGFIVLPGARTLLAQSNWNWQNPDIQGNTLSDVQFVTPQVAYAVGDLGTVLKSTDGGQTWTDVSVKTTKDFYTTYFLNADTGWVSGNWSGRNGGGTESLYKTTDGGRHWKTEYADASIHDLTFMDADTGWAVGDDELVQKTTDGGDSWNTLHYSSDYSANTFYGLYSRDSVLWAVGTNGTILNSPDYGKTFVSVDAGVSGDLHSIDFVSDSVGYIAGNKYDYSAGGNIGFIMKTVAAGSTWTTLSTSFKRPLNYIHFNDSMHGWAAGGMSTNDGYSPDSSNYIIRTQDGGKTWSAASVSHGPLAWNSVAMYDNMHGVAVGVGGQIALTSDGGATWTDNALTGTNFRQVYFVNKQVGWAVGGATLYGAVFHTVDGGQTWKRQSINLGDRQTLNGVYFLDENTGWVYGVNNGWDSAWVLYKTTDGGQTWTAADPGVDISPVSLSKMQFLNSNEGWLSNGGTLLHTSDGGNSWAVDTTGLGADDVFFVDSQHGWAGGASGEILATNDGGKTWTVQRKPDQFNQEDINSIYFVNADSGWTAGDRGTVLFTSNGGNTWNELSTGVYYDLYDIQFVSGKIGWVAGNTGYILGTNDGGQSWRYFLNVTNSDINDIFFLDKSIGWLAGSNGALLSTSNGGGIVTAISDPPATGDNQPDRFTLKQNYPNPFNPTTTIRYDLVKTSHVRLTVYNVLGQRVAELVNKRQTAGNYHVIFKASQLASGVYFYRLQANNKVLVKKMMLMK